MKMTKCIVIVITRVQGAAEKANPLACFANSLATDYNFLMKLCIDVVVFIFACNFQMLFNNLEI